MTTLKVKPQIGENREENCEEKNKLEEGRLIIDKVECDNNTQPQSLLEPIDDALNKNFKQKKQYQKQHNRKSRNRT